MRARCREAGSEFLRYPLSEERRTGPEIRASTTSAIVCASSALESRGGKDRCENVRAVARGDGGYCMLMLLKTGDSRVLGGDAPRLRFGEEPKAEGAWAGRRLLLLDDRPAFELSFWCGTCPFIFKRLEGANDTTSLEELQSVLNQGIDDVDDEVVEAFGSLLESGVYVPLLLEVTPRLQRPVEAGDYFAEEQVTTWGLDGFWGLPGYPSTPYYRTYDTAISSSEHLYEFIVPMVPPSWNDSARVAEFRERLTESSRPTAVAVSVLDVCQPATLGAATDYHAHWGLTHFLLDGHHKLEAAATDGRTVRLLSLLCVDASLAQPDVVARAVKARSQSPSRRQI